MLEFGLYFYNSVLSIMYVIFFHLLLSSYVSSCHSRLCYLIINDLNKYVFLVCRNDYLRVSNNNHTVGTYCGGQSGRNIIVTGRYAVLTFHSDYSIAYRGYKLVFSFVPPGKYKGLDIILSN